MSRFRSLCLVSAAALLIGSSVQGATPPADAANPFAAPSTLPLEAPPFDRIKDTDYKPAIEEGMRQQSAEIETIANSAEPATFDNTVLAMEKSGRMLERANLAFSAVVQANTNDTLDATQTDISPKLAAHNDSIFLNPKLFARVKAVYEGRDKLTNDAEAQQVTTLYYNQFIHAGAQLNDTDKTELMAINKEVSSLETSFQQKLIAGTKAGALVIGDEKELDGLTADEIKTAAKAAEERGLKGKWLIPLRNTTQQPSLETLSNRAVRQQLFNASWLRTSRTDKNDTREIIARLAQLRARKAQLLGYADYASYALYDQMAKTPAGVENFLNQLQPAVRAKAANEAELIQAEMDKDGVGAKLQPWDWVRYGERVRKAKFDLDESQVKPYFELNRVLKDGVFYAATKLYGITFKERHDIPVYQADVRVFDVMDKDGSQLGLFYCDYFKRDNKAGGAWMSNFVNQAKIFGTKPVVFNVANLTKPAPGQPALISSDDVRTMFHEFGHALHGLFADQKYPLISGTNTARDFVEFPSQFNEHWALDSDVLKHYAIHYKTGEVIPDALVEKIKTSRTWGQGYALGEAIAASQLDMQWHAIPPGSGKKVVDVFELKALHDSHTDFPGVPPRYRSSYFLHIWANGYAAGYYAYSWTSMLENAAYSWFEHHGGMTRENGQRFRDMILSKGHTMDYGPMFRAFYGKDPDIEPMLEQRGLVQPKKEAKIN